MSDKPVILLTPGDAGGIGPELVARTLEHPEVTNSAKRVIAGHRKIFDMGHVGILSMYHDQCQIATKLPGFDDGVTYFGGMPFILATPAHGTAFGIAGQGKAHPSAILKALELACCAALNARGIADDRESA